MTRLRSLNAFLLGLVIVAFAVCPGAAGKAAVATSAQDAPVVTAQVGSTSGAQKASEGLHLLGLGAVLILGASLMRWLAPHAQSKSR